MKILCLGDSLTEGYDIKPETSWPHLLQGALNVEVINAGISGDTTAGMLARCERLLLKDKPTHVVLLGGTNDLWFGLKDDYILANIHAISRQAKYHGVTCIIGIPTPSVNLNELNNVEENYSECIRSFKRSLITYCTNDNQPFIDFGHSLEPMHFLADGLHPNEVGHKVMTRNAEQIFEGLL